MTRNLCMRLPAALVAWLTMFYLSQVKPIYSTDTIATPIRPRTIGLYARGTATDEEAALDSNGAPHIQQVFVHRFSQALGNETERRKLETALDFILVADTQLQNTFNAPPSSTQQLLRDPASGGPSALKVIQLARDLASAVTARGGGLDATAVTGILTQMAAHLAELSPPSCHPVTRRMVLASLVRLQLALHQSGLQPGPQALRDSPETATLLFRICRQLFNLHRQGAAAKGAIEFLHISKSGGTSMCSVADRNGCTAESTTNFGNCMVRRFDDRPRWVSAEVHNLSAPLDGWRWFYRYAVRRGERSCEYRDEFMKRMRFNFYSNEFAVHGGLEANGTGSGAAGTAAGTPWRSAHLCPQFLNVVLLRQPLARLVSHVKWIIKVYRAEYGRRSEAFFRARDADYWRAFAPAAVDNYYIRLLLGEAVFYLPTGGVNVSHLAAAKLVLLQYDVVMMLEANDIDDLWLKMALGWRVGLSSAHARVAANHRATNELVPYDMDELMAANAEDVELYDFGAVLHQLDGLMFAAVEAVGIQPYSPYAELDPADERVGQRVRCGYVTRRQQFLTNMGLNASQYDRNYDTEFPRILSADERPRSAPPPAVAAQLEQHRRQQLLEKQEAQQGRTDQQQGRGQQEGQQRRRVAVVTSRSGGQKRVLVQKKRGPGPGGAGGAFRGSSRPLVLAKVRRRTTKPAGARPT